MQATSGPSSPQNTGSRGLPSQAAGPSPTPQNTYCVRCGHNIGGMLPGSACGKCRLPIACTLEGPRLIYADVGWLKRLHKGATWGIIAVTIKLGTFPLSAIFILLAPPVVAAGFYVCGALVALGFALTAIYNATVQEPRVRETESQFSPRRIARVGVATLVLLELASLSRDFTESRLVEIVAAFAELLAVIAVAIGGLALLHHGLSIARRATVAKLANSVHALFWGYCGLYALSTIAIAYAAIAGRKRSDRSGSEYGVESVLNALVLAASIALFIASIVVIVQFRKSLRKTIVAARGLAFSHVPSHSH